MSCRSPTEPSTRCSSSPPSREVWTTRAAPDARVVDPTVHDLLGRSCGFCEQRTALLVPRAPAAGLALDPRPDTTGSALSPEVSSPEVVDGCDESGPAI